MTAVLDRKAADRLAKLCGMFGSAHEGERAAAAQLADRMLRELGLTWPDVIAVPLAPDDPADDDEVSWEEALRCCLAHISQLDARSQSFVHSLARWRGEPSERQQVWLFDLFERIQRGR
jgi:hypothetical protein